jgi:hypothetical protein
VLIQTTHDHSKKKQEGEMNRNAFALSLGLILGPALASGAIHALRESGPRALLRHAHGLRLCLLVGLDRK